MVSSSRFYDPYGILASRRCPGSPEVTRENGIETKLGVFQSSDDCSWRSQAGSLKVPRSIGTLLNNLDCTPFAAKS